MDARSAESPLTIEDRELPAQLGAISSIRALAIPAAGVVLIAVAALSYFLLSRQAEPGSLLSPPLIALLLVGNLIPAIALMVLLSRRVARRRAALGGLGSGRLHTRLVALFSTIAAVPTVIVVIFASLLLQSGLEFWFSGRARSMLENTVEVARTTYRLEVSRLGSEAVAMSGDVSDYLQQIAIDDPRFKEALAYQAYQRSLNEAAVLNIRPDRQVQTLAIINGYEGMIDQARIKTAVNRLKREPEGTSVDADTPGRLSVVTRLSAGPETYLYVARWVDPELASQMKRASDVLEDYQALQVRSRRNQLRFNAILLIGAIVIVGLAIVAALKLADRLVRPMGQLVTAAGRVEEGDFSARVQVEKTEDEIETLATAFNRMTGRIEEQTGALRAANTQLDTRRAFIEAVLSSVTAGVIALDTDGRILLTNRSTAALLHRSAEQIEGMLLAEVSEDLAEFMRGERPEADVAVQSGSGQRTLAVKRVRYRDGAVLTFDDITEQLSDQRRAAWSDIARRIAHEIRNPLTKPVFREENVIEIARQALFLHEVAHPAITFALEPVEGSVTMVCDRQQLSQALTNIVKNAVEAIESRMSRGEHSLAGDRVDLKLKKNSDDLVIDVLDTGIGLPEDRERLTEPYVTTRVRGTGLGLAIVKKIVEEHQGVIAFHDRPGGGTHVRIAFDVGKLSRLASEEAGDVSSSSDPQVGA
jgi:two-component system nitrogen regulation sensor histidine kinase NtrY